MGPANAPVVSALMSPRHDTEMSANTLSQGGLELPEKLEIKRAIRDGLDDINRPEPENDTAWTRAILTKLCQIGRNRFGCKVGAEKSKVDKAHRDWGEWLYDVTWLRYDNDRHEHLIDVPLVAECEWAGLRGIRDDFHKLLLARADVRLMIYNGRREGTNRPGSQAIAQRLAGSVREFRYCQAEDAWLLAGWENQNVSSDQEFRFSYFTIDRNGAVASFT